MKGYNKCLNGHFYKESLNKCPYCHSDKRVFTETTFEYVSGKGDFCSKNEDSIGIDEFTPNGKVFVVCDAIGDDLNGVAVSNIAVNSIIGYFKTIEYSNIFVAIDQAFQFANKKILEYQQGKPNFKGICSSAAVLVIKNDDCFIGHVGKSRIYLKTEKELNRLTKDHSFVQNLVDCGVLSDSEARWHPQKKNLLKALGLKSEAKATICTSNIKVKAGDVFLLCSDGLSDNLMDSEMEGLIHHENIKSSKLNLYNSAIKKSQDDYIVLLLVEIASSSWKKKSVFQSFNPKIISNNMSSSTKGYNKCLNGHHYKESLNQCPYCPSSDSLVTKDGNIGINTSLDTVQNINNNKSDSSKDIYSLIEAVLPKTIEVINKNNANYTKILQLSKDKIEVFWEIDYKKKSQYYLEVINKYLAFIKKNFELNPSFFCDLTYLFDKKISSLIQKDILNIKGNEIAVRNYLNYLDDTSQKLQAICPQLLCLKRYQKEIELITINRLSISAKNNKEKAEKEKITQSKFDEILDNNRGVHKKNTQSGFNKKIAILFGIGIFALLIFLLLIINQDLTTKIISWAVALLIAGGAAYVAAEEGAEGGVIIVFILAFIGGKFLGDEIPIWLLYVISIIAALICFVLAYILFQKRKVEVENVMLNKNQDRLLNESMLEVNRYFKDKEQHEKYLDSVRVILLSDKELNKEYEMLKR